MRQWFMDHSCASKPWLMIFKHKASRPLSDLARDSLEFKTISYNKSTVTEHCMQNGRWKKHAEKKHRMVLLVQTSVQARWWGGRMGEALGKTQVKFKCANSQWTQSSILYTPNWKGEPTAHFRLVECPAVPTLWRTEASARAPPNYGRSFFPFHMVLEIVMI